MPTNNKPSYPLTLPLEHHLVGDDWDGFYQLSVEIDGQPPGAALALVELVLALENRRPPQGAVVLSSVVPAQILLVSAALWRVRILPQKLPGISAGRWKYQVRFTDAAGVRKTYYQGDMLVAKSLDN